METGGQLSIRRYRSEDFEAVWEMHFEGLDAIGTRIEDPSLDEDLGRREEVYLAGGGAFLVGTVGGRTLAMGALKRTSGRRAEVKRMRVRPGCWRRGYGREMLSALERRAAELGYVTLHLDTTVGQTAARRLYGKNGFRGRYAAPPWGLRVRVLREGSSREGARERLRLKGYGETKTASRSCYIS
jgi:GNAT superfamily N-acetyltransferase